MPNPTTKATVTDITNIIGTQEASVYSVTFNLWCPCPPRFPAEGGCGQLIKAYGLSGDLSSIVDDIAKWKMINVRCPHCRYQFVPAEVYT